jgi:hypothetical protein
MADAIASALVLEPESLLSKSITRLRLAQAAFEAGQPLFRGEREDDLPAGLRRWLDEMGQLDPSCGQPGERRERP